MNKTNFEQGLCVIPKNGYKVSETTATIVDCIRMHSAIYSKLGDAFELIYGENDGENRLNDIYLPLWSKLDDLLYEELKMSIEQNLIELSNLHNTEEIVL